ncbi:MAG: NapC/NirT family cytochrome c, partial [Bacteroidales bacterium]|nr:NapC/NirT family cytochrome c [Bacteroidales bacterium]
MKLPRSFYSWTSVAGAALAFISLMLIVFMMLLSFIFGKGDNYTGLFTFIILPVFLIIGLILIPVGAIRKMRKLKKQDYNGEAPETKLPIVNLNEPAQRTAVIIFILGSTIFLMLSAIGSYEAFHYSESVEFCGTLCHSVMEPEYVAYQNSSHARVSCVTCHVGPGAGWYVKSKMSGLYQVYAVTTGNFPRPIPTPISNLRPARETCEQCHWPEKFYARKLVTKKHFLADETNSEWDIHLNIKTGPSLSALGLQEGIHWHINPDVKIEYIAASPKGDEIPWVRYTNSKTNEVYIYEDSDNPLENPDDYQDQIRTMDCIDCHNRPSHHYRNPIDFVDDALTSGRISTSLPEIKLLSMQVLMPEYTSRDSARLAIESEVKSFYESSYPEVIEKNMDLINQAIGTLQEEFSKNIFPEMRVRWDVYPSHLGHVETIGCARCHNDRHTTADNSRVIRRDCNLCHEITAQGS